MALHVACHQLHTRQLSARQVLLQLIDGRFLDVHALTARHREEACWGCILLWEVVWERIVQDLTVGRTSRVGGIVVAAAAVARRAPSGNHAKGEQEHAVGSLKGPHTSALPTSTHTNNPPYSYHTVSTVCGEKDVCGLQEEWMLLRVPLYTIAVA